MSAKPPSGGGIVALVGGMFVAGAALGAEPVAPGQPEWGQDGKDVIWVPTPDVLVDKMLDMARVGPGDYLVDLGSGDGRLVIAAARRGARAGGIEYNPELVELSRRAAEAAGVADRTSFVQADIFESDFSRATVVTMFLGEKVNLKLRPKLLALRPGTRIVSNTFALGEWAPDETAVVEEGCNTWCEAFFWSVPLRVAGVWSDSSVEMTLNQEFQMLEGTLTRGNELVGIIGRMAGDRIKLVAGSDEYVGRVEGSTISGWHSSGNRWTANRAETSP